MFERFTRDARTAVENAVREAERLGSSEVDPLHLLAAITRDADGAGVAVLAELGVSAGDVAGEIVLTRRSGGVSAADAEALESLGIDVEAVVDRVQREHGRDALVGGGRRRRLWGRVRFADAAKKTLEGSLREAILLDDNEIGGDYLLLALAARPGSAADVLATFGVTADAIRGVLRQAA